MKVLHIITRLDQGGLETYLLRYLSYDKDNLAYVLCKSGLLGDMEEQYDKLGHVRLLPLRVGFLNISDFYKLYQFMKKEEFDTICDYTGNFAGFSLAIGKMAKVKKRIAFYRGATNHFKENIINLLYNYLVKKFTFYFSTKILSNSKAALDFFYPNIYINNPKFGIIYNGIDCKEYDIVDKEKIREEFNIPYSGFIVGHTGRYNYAKNHDTIMTVAVTLCKKYKDIHFVLVGKGVDEKYTELVKKVNMEKQIHLLGYRNDVLRVLNLFDLFYFPSITEGQPNSLIEAMISKIPFIASNIPSIRETVPECKSKLLLPPMDISLAINTIEELYLDRTKLKECECSEWAIENFNSDILFEKFKACL